MKNVCAAGMLLCVSSGVHAANSVIFAEDGLNAPWRDPITDGYHNLKYQVEQIHLGTTKDTSTGIFTASYQGIHAVDEPIHFDSKGGTRELAFFSLQANASFNKYEIVYDSRIPLDWDASYIRYERNFYIKDTSGNILYQDLGNQYDEQDFRDYQPVSFFGEPYVGYENHNQDSTTVGSIYTYAWDHEDYTYNPDNDALFAALRGDGVVLETYETITMHVINEDGDDVGKSIEAWDGVYASSGLGNNYNSNVNFEFMLVDSVPEPSSTALLGLSGLFLTLRRKR